MNPKIDFCASCQKEIKVGHEDSYLERFDRTYRFCSEACANKFLGLKKRVEK